MLKFSTSIVIILLVLLCCPVTAVTQVLRINFEPELKHKDPFPPIIRYQHYNKKLFKWESIYKVYEQNPVEWNLNLPEATEVIVSVLNVPYSFNLYLYLEPEGELEVDIDPSVLLDRSINTRQFKDYEVFIQKYSFKGSQATINNYWAFANYRLNGEENSFLLPFFPDVSRTAENRNIYKQEVFDLYDSLYKAELAYINKSVPLHGKQWYFARNIVEELYKLNTAYAYIHSIGNYMYKMDSAETERFLAAFYQEPILPHSSYFIIFSRSLIAHRIKIPYNLDRLDIAWAGKSGRFHASPVWQKEYEIWLKNRKPGDSFYDFLGVLASRSAQMKETVNKDIDLNLDMLYEEVEDSIFFSKLSQEDLDKPILFAAAVSRLRNAEQPVSDFRIKLLQDMFGKEYKKQVQILRQYLVQERDNYFRYFTPSVHHSYLPAINTEADYRNILDQYKGKNVVLVNLGHNYRFLTTEITLYYSNYLKQKFKNQELEFIYLVHFRNRNDSLDHLKNYVAALHEFGVADKSYAFKQDYISSQIEYYLGKTGIGYFQVIDEAGFMLPLSQYSKIETVNESEEPEEIYITVPDLDDTTSIVPVPEIGTNESLKRRLIKTPEYRQFTEIIKMFLNNEINSKAHGSDWLKFFSNGRFVYFFPDGYNMAVSKRHDLYIRKEEWKTDRLNTTLQINNAHTYKIDYNPETFILTLSGNEEVRKYRIVDIGEAVIVLTEVNE